MKVSIRLRLTEIVGKKVIQASVSIVSSKDVEQVLVHHGRMIVALTRSDAVGQDCGPLLLGEIEFVKVGRWTDQVTAAG